jgi:hypothetical protein
MDRELSAGTAADHTAPILLSYYSEFMLEAHGHVPTSGRNTEYVSESYPGRFTPMIFRTGSLSA